MIKDKESEEKEKDCQKSSQSITFLDGGTIFVNQNNTVNDQELTMDSSNEYIGENEEHATPKDVVIN